MLLGSNKKKKPTSAVRSNSCILAYIIEKNTLLNKIFKKPKKKKPKGVYYRFDHTRPYLISSLYSKDDSLLCFV